MSRLQLGEPFMHKLNSDNWKERNAAMEAVDQMIRSVGGRILPTVGDLMLGLKVTAALSGFQWSRV